MTFNNGNFKNGTKHFIKNVLQENSFFLLVALILFVTVVTGIYLRRNFSIRSGENNPYRR
jgi:hypothetical protein